MIDINKVKRVWATYALIRKLSAINGPNVNPTLLDRVMYNSETLPPLGKEYWWFLFFGQNGEKPAQVMSLIFRKYGKKMVFNDKEMVLRNLGKNRFRAVTAGWVYDGRRLHDLGDTNAIIKIQQKKIVSEILGRKIILGGGFPDYILKIGDTIDLNIKKANYLEDNEAYGVFIPPFGCGWVNVYLTAEGTVLGEKFKGTAHLQKVVGIMPYGPFHWGRVIFQNGSFTSLFCLKTGKESRRYLHRSMTFYDNEGRKTIQFENPKLKILKKEGKKPTWIIEGEDNEKKLRIVLEAYATKSFTMKGGGSQVYIEYAVTPTEFSLKTKDEVITLNDLGGGVGTFEDAQGSIMPTLVDLATAAHMFAGMICNAIILPVSFVLYVLKKLSRFLSEATSAILFW